LKVNQIVTHYRGHNDELFGVWQLKRFGKDLFLGVKDAQIEFANYELGLPERHTLYVGVGNPEKHSEYREFNEHRQDGRLRNECAASLIAKRLGFPEEGTELFKLLRETLWADSEPGVFSTQLPSLIKTMHRVKGGADQLGTYHWACKAYDAIVFGTRDEQNDLRGFWQLFCNEENVDRDSKPFQTVDGLIHASFGRRNGITQEKPEGMRFVWMVTELSSIVMRMEAEAAYQWLTETFSMMLVDAKMFLATVDEVNANVVAFDVRTETATAAEPAYFIESDSEHIGKASASILTGKATICVVRRSNGHTQIFSNPDARLQMWDFVAMLRMAEYRKWKGKCLSPSRAFGEGTIPEVRQWHLPNPNTILNGALTHMWIPPSALTLGEIMDIARAAFTAFGRDQWISRYLQEDLIEDPMVRLATAMDLAVSGKN
jgi:hypothetical protein